MKDKRGNDRRKKVKPFIADRRRGPRRLTCSCGGKVEAVAGKKGVEMFICLRCGKKI